jgi:hypothetical protein
MHVRFHTIMWSRHSRRTEPINAFHERIGVSRALHLVMRISHTFSPSPIRSIRCTAKPLSC